ncbi:MAG: hypothetical protein AB7I37_03830 [Pirellulales bacterium]
MLKPYVDGQSGTAMPALVVVTRPPTQIKGKVAHANTTASLCGQGLPSPPEAVSSDWREERDKLAANEKSL